MKSSSSEKIAVLTSLAVVLGLYLFLPKVAHSQNWISMNGPYGSYTPTDLVFYAPDSLTYTPTVIGYTDSGKLGVYGFNGSSWPQQTAFKCLDYGSGPQVFGFIQHELYTNEGGGSLWMASPGSICTWKMIASTACGGSTLRYFVLKTLAGVHFFGTRYCGLYYSTDSIHFGIVGGLPSYYYVRDIISHGNKLFLVPVNTGAYDTLYQSSNNGAQWTPILAKDSAGNPLTEDINCLASNGVTLYASCFNGDLIHSTDNGVTWHLIHKFTDISYSGARQVVLSGADFFVCTDSNIWRSHDAAKTWRIVNGGLKESNPPLIFDSSKLALYVMSAKSGVYVFDTSNDLDYPDLIAPKNYAVGVNTNQSGDTSVGFCLPQPDMVKWQPAVNAQQYTIEFCTDPAFPDAKTLTIKIASGTTSTYTGWDPRDSLGVIKKLQPYTTYYWRMRTERTSPGFKYSSWSYIFSFRTALPQTKPSYPNDSANQISLTPTFAWQSIANGSKYEIQVSLSPTFIPLVFTTKVTGTSVAISSSLSIATRYFWRVRAIDKDTGFGGWSCPIVFSTIFPTPTLYISTPLSNGIDLSAVQLFKWHDNTLNRKWGYRMQFSEQSDFSSIPFSFYSDTIFVYTQVLKAKTYYWRLQAFDSSTGFGGAWTPSPTYSNFSTAKDQIYFSPIRDGFSWINAASPIYYPTQAFHWNSARASLQGGLFPIWSEFSGLYHDYENIFRYNCHRRYWLFGPIECDEYITYPVRARYSAVAQAWGGSCYGFAMNAIERYAANAPATNLLPANDPNRMTVDRSMMYQYSNQLENIQNSQMFAYQPSQISDRLRSLFANPDKTQQVTLAIFPNASEGHAITPYLITTKVVSGETIDLIRIYDPNDPTNMSIDYYPDLQGDRIEINRNRQLWSYYSHGSLVWSSSNRIFLYTSVADLNNGLSISGTHWNGHPTNRIQSIPASTVSFFNTSLSGVPLASVSDSKGHSFNMLNDSSSSLKGAYSLSGMGGLASENYRLHFFGIGVNLDSSNGPLTFQYHTDTIGSLMGCNVSHNKGSMQVTWVSNDTTSRHRMIFDPSTNVTTFAAERNLDSVEILAVQGTGDSTENHAKISNIKMTRGGVMSSEFRNNGAEFRITNNDSVKYYNIEIALGISVVLPGIHFDTGTTHIYTIQDFPKDSLTKVILTIDQSSHNLPDSTITFEGTIDSLLNVAEWRSPSGNQHIPLSVFPNPSNQVLTLMYELSHSSSITVDIVNVSGIIEKTLVNDMRESGVYRLTTDVSSLPSGVYTIRVVQDGILQTLPLRITH